MKISDTARVGKTGSIKKSSTRSVDGDFSSLIGNADAASSISSSGEIESVQNILSIQEVGSEGGKSQAFNDGFDLLDYLEDIRMCILNGEYGKSQLKNIQMIIERIDSNDFIKNDEKLKSILDEIKLRVVVEKAKLEALE